MILIFENAYCLKVWISLIEIPVLLQIYILFNFVNLFDFLKCLSVLFHLGFQLLAVHSIEHGSNEIGASEHFFLVNVSIASAFAALVMVVMMTVVMVMMMVMMRASSVSWLLARYLFELNIVSSVVMVMSMSFLFW